MRSVVFLLIILLSGCVSQSGLISSGQIYKGINKSEIESLSILANQFQHPFAITAKRKYFESHNVEIIAPADGSIYYVFKNVSIPSNPSMLSGHAGTGNLHSWHSSMDAAQDSANELMGTRREMSVYKAPKKEFKKIKPRQDQKNTIAKPDSVQVLWQRFLEAKKFEALADVYYLCEGKALFFEDLENKKPYTTQNQWVSFSVEIVEKDKRNQYGFLGHDHAVGIVGSKVGALAAAESRYMGTLVPPNFKDRDWCNRTQCLDRQIAYWEQLENELEQCKQISEWYID